MSDENIAEHVLGRVWYRDRSQDAGRTGVYISAATEATPGRGGFESFEFAADGRFTMTGPGADNRTAAHTGTWHVDQTTDDRILLQFDAHDTHGVVKFTSSGTMTVEFVTPD